MFAECLWSAEDCVIESLLYSNLSRDRFDNHKLLSTLNKLKDQSAKQPGSYMQQLVGLDGRSPSTSQLLKMVNIMEAYVTVCRTTDTAGMSGVIDDVDVNRINDWSKRMNSTSHAKAEQGYRRYMYRKPRKTTDDDLFFQGSKKYRKTADGALLSGESSDILNFYKIYNSSHILEPKHFMAELRFPPQVVISRRTDRSVRLDVQCVAQYD